MASFANFADFGSAVELFLLLLAAVALGHLMLPRLPERHRSRETLDTVRIISGIAITFASLVLGLLTASVNNAFSVAENDMTALANSIRQVDTCLQGYGPETAPIRSLLRAYTAGAIYSTWPEEGTPSGAYPTDQRVGQRFENLSLGDLLQQVRVAVGKLPETDSTRKVLASLCAEDVARLVDNRWRLIGEAHSTVSLPFYRLLVLMLLTVFATVGLNAPRSPLALLSVAFGAVTITTAVFVVLELDDPLDGFVKISSASMRNTLATLDR